MSEIRRARDPEAPQPDKRLVTRRHAVGLGIGAGFVAVAAGAVTFAFAASDTKRLTVWQLAADWKEPRGPHNKTHLQSAASRHAATYRFARTEADALLMNLHVGSWAPAVAVSVDGAVFEDLWAQSSRTWQNTWADQEVSIVDIRWDTSSGKEVDARYANLSIGPDEASAVTKPNGMAGDGGSLIPVGLGALGMWSMTMARRRHDVAQAELVLVERQSNVC